MAVHMAKSVQYKNVYPDKPKLDNAVSVVKILTDDLQSKATDLVNNNNLSNVKSTIEEQTGINLDDAKTEIEKYTEKLPI